MKDEVRQFQMKKVGKISILEARDKDKEYELNKLKMEREQKEDAMKKEIATLKNLLAFKV